jgi:anti-sigma regulatory factor (Ser/Thr protein kinase)
MIPMDPSPADAAFASLIVPSQVESVRKAATFLVQSAKDMRVPLASDSVFELAIVEALNNAIKHGDAGRRGAMIVCEMERAAHRLTVRILDQGPGFALPIPPAKSDPEDVLAVPESGYGLSIIQSVFPTMRTISRDGHFGVEMSVTF